jgi:alpha-pyrone synthase
VKAAIRAIGTATPKFKRAQLEAVDLIAAGLQLSLVEKRRLKSIYKGTGIEYRYSVLSDYCKEPGRFEIFPNHPSSPFPTTAERMQIYKNEACPLALSAVKNCLESLGNFDKQTITHLITVSCTGMYAPGIDIELVHALQLNTTVQRTTINFMGCYGAFNGLKVADAICKADPKATVLIVCVELCSIHFQNNRAMDSLISNAIFADGAAATIVQVAQEGESGLCLETFHCDLLAQTSKEMAWHIGDSGFDIVLSSFIPEIIKTGISAFVEGLLDKYQTTWSDIAFYAIHPGGIKILEACEKALNIKAHMNQYSYEVLRNYGNMSSATVLFVLKSIWNNLGRLDHQKLIFSCAFGPGLTLESMLLKINFP